MQQSLLQIKKNKSYLTWAGVDDARFGLEPDCEVFITYWIYPQVKRCNWENRDIENNELYWDCELNKVPLLQGQTSSPHFSLNHTVQIDHRQNSKLS